MTIILIILGTERSITVDNVLYGIPLPAVNIQAHCSCLQN